MIRGNAIALARLGDLCEVNPRQFTVPISDDDVVSFVPMKAVGAETRVIDLGECRSWREVKKGFTAFQDGDVIFAKITPCMENGKFALAKGLHQGRAAGSTEFHVLRSKGDLLPAYVLWFLFSPEVRRNAKASMGGAVGQQRVPPSYLNDLQIPLRTLEEQSQVVDRIELQISRLEAGVAALKRVQANLKRYRASVLKAACEGRLVPTEAELARQEGRTYETGEQLLTRILDERRASWPGKGKYKEPTPPDATGLPELPEGWTWASLDQLSRDSAYGTSAKCDYSGKGVPVLRIPNVSRGRIDLSDLKRSLLDDPIQEGAELLPGDLLVIRTNGSKSLIGRSAVVLSDLPDRMSYASYLIRFRLATIPHVPQWLSTIWDNQRQRSWLESHAATSAGQHNISMTTLALLPIPLPPLAEQERIADETERCLSVGSMLEATLTTSSCRTTSLRQTVLQSFFA